MDEIGRHRSRRWMGQICSDAEDFLITDNMRVFSHFNEFKNE